MPVTNPLLAPWPGPFGGLPPWDQVTPDLFPEAFGIALADEQRRVADIASNPAPPDFANTVEALQRVNALRDRVWRVFNVMRLNTSSEAYRALDLEWQPRFAEADDAITFWPGLFERIDAVYRTLPDAALAGEQARLVTFVWEEFVRAGSRLDAPSRSRLSRINRELALLYAEFRAKVMASEDTWTHVMNPADLEGLPAALVAAAAAAARERGLDGWVILNTRSSVDPCLTFAASRTLREQVWRRFKMRGDEGDGADTKATITAIVSRRAERARLLGYDSHVHWQMADSMAGDPERARRLLFEVWEAATRTVRQDVAAMQAVAVQDDPSLRIEPWDYLYYAERVRRTTFDLDVAELSAYLSLEQMLQAALWSAAERYDLSFLEITGQVPTFHPDVRVWEVRDRPDGSHRGVFYFDTFARPGKRSGAWASTYRVQRRMDGGATAVVSNNNNFLKGAPGEPVLLSLDDVRTLFHEFGHSLHALLQDITYPVLGETPRDFVELPSQINEQWVYTRELLDRFARHHQTGEPLPEALLEKVRATEAFNQGYATAEAVAAAIVDLELHTRADGVFEPAAFEREMLERIGMPGEIALRHRLTHFDHLFGSDGYSGLYYSYLWADVMATDAWQAFLEAGGPWDRGVSARFRRCILADGNTSDRAEAYRRFRGRDPEVRALLEARGLVAS